MFDTNYPFAYEYADCIRECDNNLLIVSAIKNLETRFNKLETNIEKVDNIDFNDIIIDFK